jgi:hypothetical protein
MEKIVARLRRIIPTRIADTVMNGIVPVLIVIGICSIPTAVMRLERVMRPTNAGVRAGNDDRFSFESECPHVRRMRVINARLDRRRRARCARQ